MGVQSIASKLSPVVSRQEIAESVRRLAGQLNHDYANRSLMLVAVLKGSFMFLADLVRNLVMPVQMDFTRVVCYGDRTEPTAPARIISGPRIPVRGKDVVIVEDIVDTGLTTQVVLRYLCRKGATSVKLCALLDKPERRQVPVTIDYLGMRVPNRFLVGYGLDFAEEYRQLPDIYALEE